MEAGRIEEEEDWGEHMVEVVLKQAHNLNRNMMITMMFFMQ